MQLAKASNSELVIMAQDRNKAAFTELLARHDGRAYIIALDMLRDNQHDAHDALQEARVRAWDGIQRVRDGLFGPWFYGIVRNCCTDLYKRQQEEMGWAISENVEIAAPLEQLMLRDARSYIRGAVDALPPQQSHAIKLHCLESRDYAEVAEQMALSETTVRRHISIGLNNLRERLADSDFLAEL